ncbi:hypothetical protein N7532_002574 [Penicillium argentinense]|uniref:chitinase n=1 Tax=Penicillium argentinense TaxID=1131581 RepID=A0A9W9G0M2_9EURO|nr:uncharacterized protein N7532_002574 [Penicillium argentinense]KAJ5109929.1 hypothetical protein N7532_002574 [Penicillium argentinense]
MHAVVVSSEVKKELADLDQTIVAMTAIPSVMRRQNVGNEKCPLNVCCSKFGHCGTTAEFCGGNCQNSTDSSCEEHPAPPQGASPLPVLTNKVIGYYQSWAERRSCHTFPPDAIPVEGLTHLNYAFAYINPDSLEITVMDDQTPESSFARTTDIKNTKLRNSELQIFASIGGWTFSDNKTATQPLFSDIAADSGKRLKFANNLLSFMVHFGFDGVDLDWEYPGAGDRGGNKKDVKNYVLLMKTIREKFDSSARVNYGLSFTIPTSYWYLRWFDVPGLLKYADWVNMMSYDLHGVWDENNPIGNKVHPHTNLTEIKQASELLWRNDVAPAKVVLGVGFYGRSFHLKHTNCTKPGCDFHGDAQKGDCTKSSGTLAYFEIQDIIKKEHKNVTYDEDAAVNWITYGDGLDNWVSYDDAKTLKQKVDYADEVGLGGVMIWSVDQDDESFTALEGLIGKSLPSYHKNQKRTHLSDTNHWKSLNAQSCKISDCVDSDSEPPSGFGRAPNGKFPDKCGSGKSKFIWCPLNEMPNSCTWRGSGSCHGQCHPGEVTLTHSTHGDTKCLAPGQQAFCCKSNTWSKLTDKCGWGPMDDTCPDDAPYAVSSKKTGLFHSHTVPWCCPYDFQGCHWVGKGTCDDNECSATDIQAGLDDKGNTGNKCANGYNGRKKPLCCNTPANTNPFLPVALVDLFPKLPPSDDVPAWDKQSLASGDVAGGEAFLFVLVDGPSDTVTNVNKRDGSHLEFVTGGVHHGQARQTAHFVCMDDSDTSNCHDMHENGLDGTILRMPEGKGFAKYAVAHSVTISNYTVPHNRLSKRAPLGARVFELEYSYDFSKVKRDSSKEVYLRVDYGDRQQYWTDVVEAKHHKRGHTHRRFWSELWQEWKRIITEFRKDDFVGNTKPYLSNDDFNVGIYGSTGDVHGCSDAGFMKVDLKGSMTDGLRFGSSMVGTISPELSLKEAYTFFDSSMRMEGTLDVDAKGTLNINNHPSLVKDLLADPITKFEASHPGIISFSPEFNAEVAMVGQGEIDAKFTVKFESMSDGSLKSNAPPHLGDFGGSAMLQSTVKDPVDGKVWVGDNSQDTVFGVNINLESSLNIKIHDYSSTGVQAEAQFKSRIPRTIRVVGDTGSGKPGIIESPQQASVGVEADNKIKIGWTDHKDHPVGELPKQKVLFTGGERPAERKAPAAGKDSNRILFADPDEKYMTCEDEELETPVQCSFRFSFWDSNIRQPDPPYKKRSDEDHDHYNSLVARKGGPNTGGQGHYIVQENPTSNGQQINQFRFITPTYPNGNQGRALDDERGYSDAYSLQNPSVCDDPTITKHGTYLINYDNLDSEHPIDRSVIPNYFLSVFVQDGELELGNGGQTYQTRHSTWTWDELYEYFAHDYRQWVIHAPGDPVPAGSAAEDVADALGSSSNPTVMTNFERNLNIMKGQTYTGGPMSPGDHAMNTALSSFDESAVCKVISELRGQIAIFHYMQAIKDERTSVFNGIRDALQNFDKTYAKVFPHSSKRLAPLWEEFHPQWEKFVINRTRRFITMRLKEISDKWDPLQYDANKSKRNMAIRVMTRVKNIESSAATDLHF